MPRTDSPWTGPGFQPEEGRGGGAGWSVDLVLRVPKFVCVRCGDAVNFPLWGGCVGFPCPQCGTPLVTEAEAGARGRQRKWDLRYLAIAQEVAGWSKDPSTKVGAVIIGPDNTPVSFGFNGFAKGVDDSPERYADRDTKLKLTVHGERNAIIFAGHRARGGTLYTHPFMPCGPCAALAINAGLVRVVAPPTPPELEARWGEDLRWARVQFEEAGVELVILGV